MTKTILIVDDDIDDIEFLKESLEEIEPSVKFIVANDGSEGLSRLDKLTTYPDLIVLDMKMPKMNGEDFIHALKRDKRYKDIPLVVFSSTFLFTDQNYLKGLGVIQCLKKPNTYDKLNVICREIIDILLKV